MPEKTLTKGEIMAELRKYGDGLPVYIDAGGTTELDDQSYGVLGVKLDARGVKLQITPRALPPIERKEPAKSDDPVVAAEAKPHATDAAAPKEEAREPKVKAAK